MIALLRGTILFAGAALLGSGASAEEIVPLAGCYARVYDAAHLKAHPGQIVRRARLSVRKTAIPREAGEKQPILADAALALYVGKDVFASIGACYWAGVGLVCNAALSAQEARPCRSADDGVRECRVPGGDPGSFELAQKPDGLRVTIRERLELPGPEDRGSYLYLSPDNSENRAFLLQPAPDTACK